MRAPILLVSLVVMTVAMSMPMGFANENVYKITLQGHHFSPETLKVPARQKIKILIENLDPTPEEFESYELNREKVVVGHGTITLFIGPLKPGDYKYFGDFNKDTAQGVIQATE